MSFDFNKVTSDMLSVVGQNIDSHHQEVVSAAAAQFLQRDKERLQLMTELVLSGELTAEKFQSRLVDEKLLLEAELNALAVLSKAVAQKAANAAIDVFQKAVSTAMK
ncbi:MAG: hypothetical protein ACOYOT_04610 [Bacteroidales bacterium]